MRKDFLAIVLAICSMFMLMLVGCGPAEPVAPASPVAPADTSSDEPAEEPPAMPDEPVACQDDAKVCPDGTQLVRDPDNNCEFSECPEPVLPDEITTMQNKIDDLKSYEYIDSKTGHHVMVKDDLMLVVTSNPNDFKSEKMRMNAIYFDHSTQEAYGACLMDTKMKSTTQCGTDIHKYTPVQYSIYLPEDPFMEIKELTNGEIAGSQTCEKRQCDLVEYTKDGQNYRMYVRVTYILPYKIATLDGEGVEETVVTYKDAAFNHIKAEDVTLPEDFELVE